MKRNLTMAAIIAALILSPMFLNPLVIKADDNSIGSLSSVDNPDGSPNSSSNTADESITVNGSDNSGSNGELVLQTCGGYLYIDGSYYGDFFGSLQSFSVGTTGLSNGFHYVSVQPNNNCGGGGAATGTNSVDFYIQHVPAQQTCTVSINITPINNNQISASASISWHLGGVVSQDGTGSQTISGMPLGLYTIFGNPGIINYNSKNWTATSGSNSGTCSSSGVTLSLPIPAQTTAVLKLGD